MLSAVLYADHDTIVILWPLNCIGYMCVGMIVSTALSYLKASKMTCGINSTPSLRLLTDTMTSQIPSVGICIVQ